MNKGWNIVRIILATFLSIILFVVLLCTPMISAISSFVQPETVTQVVDAIDFKEVLMSNPEIKQELENEGLSAEIIDSFMNTNTVEELLDLYSHDIFNAIEGNGESIKLTAEEAKRIVNENMSELIPIVNEIFNYAGETMDVSEEQLKQGIENLVVQMVDGLPTAEELGLIGETATEEIEQAMMVMQVLHNGTVVIPFIVIVVILSLLILACRWNNLEGFMWLGVIYLIIAGLSLSIASGVKSTMSVDLMDVPSEMQSLVLSLLQVFGQKLTTSSIILGGCAFVFVIIFFVNRHIQTKKMNTVQDLV